MLQVEAAAQRDIIELKAKIWQLKWMEEFKKQHKPDDTKPTD